MGIASYTNSGGFCEGYMFLSIFDKIRFNLYPIFAMLRNCLRYTINIYTVYECWGKWFNIIGKGFTIFSFDLTQSENRERWKAKFVV